jgi:hypothetical protein
MSNLRTIYHRSHKNQIYCNFYKLGTDFMNILCIDIDQLAQAFFLFFLEL